MTQPIRILHVDDDPAVCDLTATYLERENSNFRIDTAGGAPEARTYLEESDYDCLVSDYEMPGEDGLELLASVRETHPELPFVLFTGEGSESVASEAISAGVTDYLQKGTGTEQYTILASRITNAVSRRRATESVDRQRHRSEQILSTVPSCVVQLDRDGEFVFANERAEEVLGIEESALTDHRYDDPEWHIRDFDGNPIPEEELPFRRVLETGEPVSNARHSIRWPDGTRRDLLVNGAPLLDDDGAVQSVVFSLADITDRKESERELERTNTRYRTLLDHFPDGAVFLFDETQTYTLAGGEALETLGLRQSDVIGSTPEEVFPADVVETITEHNEVALDGTATEFDVTSENRQFHLQVIPIFDGADVTGAMGVAQDVTDRRVAEHRLQTLLDCTDNLVYIKDRDGRYELVNDAFATLLDTEPAEIQGRSLADVFTESGAVESQATDETVVESGEPVTEEVTRVIDDTERVFITNKFPYYGLDGEIHGVMGISREISDRKERERTMQRQNRRLNRFASVVSHDLRNPLNLAQGRLAREECDSDHLDAVETAHERIDTLVTDLLTLARQGTVVDDDVTAVDFAALTEEAWAETSTPTATLQLDTEARIEADPERLRQLLGNLFRNAVEHSRSDVVASVESTDDGFAVTDDGPGFSEEQVSSLIGDDGDEHVSLGMSIVEEIAEAHGWDVTLSAGSDGGARIDVTGVTVV